MQTLRRERLRRSLARWLTGGGGSRVCLLDPQRLRVPAAKKGCWRIPLPPSTPLEIFESNGPGPPPRHSFRGVGCPRPEEKPC